MSREHEPSHGAPVLVSACLAGRPCRYNGTAAPHDAVLRLVEQGLAVAVCPEELGGLPTPRECVELRGTRAVTPSGRDMTSAFEAGAAAALELGRGRGCREAILKSRSPSCGCGRVYDGSFSGRLTPGEGLFAALLRREGFAVRTELDLPG